MTPRRYTGAEALALAEAVTGPTGRSHARRVLAAAAPDLARSLAECERDRDSAQAETRAMVARLELVHRALDAAGVGMDPPEARIAALVGQRDAAHAELLRARGLLPRG